MRLPAPMILAAGTVLSVLFAYSAVSHQQVAAQPLGADWPMYRGDHAGTGYSPLAAINRANVAKLVQAWKYPLQATNSQATPIVVNGVMYAPAQNRVVALEAETGKEIWQRPISGSQPSRRGVAYWPGDGTNPPRIIFTAGTRLIALEAASGALVTGFGRQGEVDLVLPYNSVPLVFKNIVVVGANTPPPPAVSPGNARAYDARTGAKLWEFSSVAGPGTVGQDTWEGESWKGRSGLNAWSFYFTLEPARVWGVADRVGSLEVGKDADVVVWSGEPLTKDAKARMVFVDGQLYEPEDKPEPRRGEASPSPSPRAPSPAPEVQP